MMQISIIIPFLSDNGDRDLAFDWVKEYYKRILPSADICAGSSEKPFNKAQAINKAVQNASGNILILVDADIICSPEAILKSIRMLKKHTWVIPYKKVLDISKESSSKLLNLEPGWPFSINIKSNNRVTGNNTPVGGINVLKRESFEAVGGFDERFLGWGGEDDAFAAAMNTLCGGFKRLNNSIYHIWHPSANWQANEHYENNLALAARYSNAYGNKNLMLELIQARNNESSKKGDQT